MHILNRIPGVVVSICALALALGSGARAFSQVSFTKVGSTNDGGTALSVVVSNNVAYLANGSDGLRIYDVSNPSFPKCIGHTNDQGLVFGVAVSGKYAYLSEYYNGLRIYDISDPTNPVYAGGGVYDGAGGTAIAVHDHYVFLRANGVEIYDVADPTNPVQLAHGLNGSSSFAFSSNCVYISYPNTSHTLYGYDVSNPASPTNVYTGPPGYIFGLAVSGHYLFGGAESFQSVSNQSVSGLVAFDISNSTNPVYLAASGGSGFSGGNVVADGNFAYWANGIYGLQVFDVSNPTGTNIVKVGEVKSGTVDGVAVAGHYAYVADNTGGLQIYAITPQLRASVNSNNTVVASWPGAGPFLLQENPDLGTSNWSTINGAPGAAGARFQVTLPGPTNNMYYRLISQ